jgi:hypothetical protein
MLQRDGGLDMCALCTREELTGFGSGGRNAEMGGGGDATRGIDEMAR